MIDSFVGSLNGPNGIYGSLEGQALARQDCTAPKRGGGPLKLIATVPQTTVAAMVASEISNKYSNYSSPVACIFADGAPATDWNDIHLEAVLLSIIRQLDPRSRYGDTKINFGEARANKIDGLRGALSSRLQQLTSAFLVLDGVDQCGCFTPFCLENLILDLQRRHPHFRVLLTSRTALLPCDKYGKCAGEKHQPNTRSYFSSELSVSSGHQLVHPTCWLAPEICNVWYVSSQFPSAEIGGSRIKLPTKLNIFPQFLF